jgi:diacylglycerol kinase
VYALRHDFSFRTQWYAAALVSILIIYLFAPLSVAEFLFLGMAAMLVLITELQNSAFETALDQIHPERHDSIKRSKDMAAGAVLLAAGFAVLVIATLGFVRLGL